jgi:CRP-like cAMP-binding protein
VAKKPAAKGAKAPANSAPTKADLKKIPAFAAMGPSDLDTFLSLMEVRAATNGEPILREGTVGEGLFVILEGSVAIVRKNAKGGEREVAILEKSEVFGEMDLISDRPHTSGAKGRPGTRLLFLPKKAFQELLRKGNAGASALVIYFARMLSARLDANNKRMMEILEAPRDAARTGEFAEFKRRLLREWSF